MMRRCWKTSRKRGSSLNKGMPIYDLMSMRTMYPRPRRTKSPCFSVILPAGIPCRVCFSQRTSVTLLSPAGKEVGSVVGDDHAVVFHRLRDDLRLGIERRDIDAGLETEP